MINIPLQALPNQSLSIQLDNNNFDLAIHSCNTNPDALNTQVMSITISLNSTETPIIIGSNIRAIPNNFLIQADYLKIYGNFIFATQNDNYPDYTQFGITQYLYYFSYTELLELGLTHAST